MVDVSDNYFRYLMRFFTKNAWLYSEMISSQAVINCKQPERLLAFTPNQHPVVFQLGGDDPYKMAQAAKIVENWGYDEVNVNCGCPSNSVKHGKFGAILMFDPHLVAAICKEMIKIVAIPVTVKCRIGVDDQD